MDNAHLPGNLFSKGFAVLFGKGGRHTSTLCPIESRARQSIKIFFLPAKEIYSRLSRLFRHTSVIRLVKIRIFMIIGFRRSSPLVKLPGLQVAGQCH